MILATYQPATPDKTLPTKTPELDDFLGYHPIWCFAANNFKEFMVNSVLAAPNAPEILYVFETSEYRSIDIVKWNTFGYHIKKSESCDLKECFSPRDEKYCEYIIRDIPNDGILLQINLHDAIYRTKYRGDTCFDDDMRELIEKLANLAADRAYECAESTYKNTQITTNGDLNRAKQWSKTRAEKQAFELYLAGFVVAPRLPGSSIFDMTAFRANLYYQKLAALSGLLVDNYNGQELPTYDRQDEILSLLGSCYRPIAPWGDRKIGRNEKCPCGSGKKYKNCCIGKYYKA